MNAMNMLKGCLNWKVLAGLGVMGAVIWIMAPGAVAAVLPVLLVLVCPLSMLLMMGGMGGQRAAQTGAAEEYACPMHSEVRASFPGKCPRCGMDLVPAASPKKREALVPAGTESSGRNDRLTHLRAELDLISEQQAALARQVEELGATGSEPSGSGGQTVQQAEQIAKAAERRGA